MHRSARCYSQGVSRYLNTLADALLPNGAFRRRASAVKPENGKRLWLLRPGIAVVFVILVLLFNMQQHQSLR
jgi:hypothetical protein